MMFPSSDFVLLCNSFLWVSSSYIIVAKTVYPRYLGSSVQTPLIHLALFWVLTTCSIFVKVNAKNQMTKKKEENVKREKTKQAIRWFFVMTNGNICFHVGKKIDRSSVNYRLQGSIATKVFKAFNALGTIAFSFGDAMLPEIQVLQFFFIKIVTNHFLSVVVLSISFACIRMDLFTVTRIYNFSQPRKLGLLPIYIYKIIFKISNLVRSARNCSFP